jgi:cell division septation protein DedD
MEHRLKVRLTGAAILVALVVLLVPEMFRGERIRGAAPSAGAADGPPVRAYTIELNGRSTAPLQNAAQAAADEPAAAATPVKPQPGTIAEATPAAAATGPALPPAAPATPAFAAPVRTAASAPTPTPTPAAAHAAPAHVASAPATHQAGGHWTVQLGLFAKRDNAERLARSAEARGFAVEVSNPDSHGLYRVHTAVTGDRSQALALQQQLKTEGFAASVMAP